MIDSAVSTLAKSAVESAKDVVQDRIEIVQDRLDDVTNRVTGRRRARRSRRVLFVLLTLAGLAALAYFIMQRMNAPDDESQIAPDAFGTAIEEERRRDVFTSTRT